MFYKSPITDLIIVLLIVVLIFGPKRLPNLGRSLGQGMREFRDGITGRSKDSEEADRAEISQTSASSATGAPAAPPPTPVPGVAEREPAEVVSPERRP